HQASAEAHNTAQQASQKAAEQVKIFDFQGVAQHLRNPHQVDVFRTLALSPSIQPFLAVERQAPLAARLVAEAAKQDNKEISGEFIRREFTRILLEEQGAFRDYTEEKRRDLLRKNRQEALRHYIQVFKRHLRGLTAAGEKIAATLKEWPDDE